MFIPLQIKILGWLILLKRIHTKDNLAKKGACNEDLKCVLCSVEEKNTDRVFYIVGMPEAYGGILFIIYK